MKKRIASLLLALLMAFTMLPVQALAEEINAAEPPAEEREETTMLPPAAEEREETPREAAVPAEQPADEPAENDTAVLANGGVVASGTCGANLTWTLDSSGVLTIEGTGKMADWNYSSTSSSWCDNQERIKQAVIGNRVTSIGDGAFSYCDSLTSVTIPNSVTSIGSAAFSDCSSLTSITIPDSVTSIGSGAFSYCSSLTSVTIPNSVTSIENGAFESCSSLTDIRVDPQNSNYCSDGGVLFNKSRTTLLQYPAGSPTSYTIPNSVTSIGNSAFSGCSSLTSVTIPNSVTSIEGWAFSGCSSLTSVTIPDSVTSIGNSAFRSCSSLTSVTIPNSVTWIGYDAFYVCSRLTSIWVDSQNNYYCSVDGVLFNKNRTTLLQYPAGNPASHYTIPNRVTSIGDGAFSGCSSLTSVTIPNSVTSIEGWAFSGCSSLTSVTIGNSMTSIGSWAFFDCSSLISITIPNSVTSLGSGAFSNCSSLTGVTIPNSVTSIGDYAFSDCSSLTSVTIPNSVTSIEAAAFYGCGSLTDVHYGGSEAQWKAISIREANDPLTSATIHYNSAGSVIDGAVDSEAFIKAHSDFARKDFSAFRNFNGFYQTVWQYENGRRLWACYAWDVIGDVGEIVTLKFNDLTISADYYEMFLSDLILHMAESEKTERWLTKASATYNKYYTQVKAGVFSSMINAIEKTPELLKKAEKEVGLTWKTTLEVEFDKQFASREYQLSGAPKALLETAFGKILKDDTVYKSIFEGLDTASSYISDFVKGGKLIYDLVNGYSLAKALKETNQELFAILYDAADELEKINPKYAKWFREPLEEFYRAATNDTELLLALKDAYFETADFVYETFLKTAFKNVIYQFVGTEILHMSAAVASTYIAAVVAAYNGTYAALNLLLKNSEKGEMYKYMNYIAPLEQALSNTTFSYGRELIFTEKTYHQARKFDTAYRMLAYTNQFLYECAYTFDKLTHHKDELPYAMGYKSRWNTTKCHDPAKTSAGTKYVSAMCPVDVYLYDESGVLVMAVVNEEITVNNAPDITVVVYDGAKSFAYPNDRDYRVEIIARDSGKMDYLIAETENDTEFREIEFYDVPLKEKQQYSGSVPAESRLPSAVYSLTSNESEIPCSYDSQGEKTAVCDASQHAYGEWIERYAATVRNEGLEERYCANCGKRDSHVIPQLICNHLNSETRSSCTEAAICSVCGGRMNLAAHVDENGDNKCDICGAFVIRGDVNGDGSVDVYDLQTLYEHCCGIETLSSDALQRADVNQDASVSVLDVQMLYTYLTTRRWTPQG